MKHTCRIAQRLSGILLSVCLLLGLVQPASAASYTYTSPYVEDVVYTLTTDPEEIALGIDVSYYQGTIDWEAVAADGVEFAFIRAAVRYSSSGTLSVDSKFYDNIEGALANGIKVGVYIFSQAITVEEAIEEADFLIDLVEGYDIDLPLVFDPEFVTSSTTGEHYGRLYEAFTATSSGDRVNFMTELGNAFITEVEEAGYVGMYYSSYSWLKNYVDTSSFSTPVWLARYNTYAGYSGEYAFWQYSSSGTVDGISTKVDCNFCLDTDYLDCQTLAGSYTEPSGSYISIDATSYPTGTMEAASFTLRGTITSNYPLESVTGTITSTDGTVVQTYTAHPYNTTFTIANSRLDNNLKFAKLEAGDYTLTYTATDTEGFTLSWTSEVFTIIASEDDDAEDSGETEETEESEESEETDDADSDEEGMEVPEEDTEAETESDADSEETTEAEDTDADPSDETESVTNTIQISAATYPTGNFTAASYTLRGTVTSDYTLTSVTGAIVRADGEIEQEATESGINSGTFSIANSAVDNGLVFGKLDAGYYYITYTAEDSAGCTLTWTSPIFAVSPTTLFTDVTNSSSWYYYTVYNMASRGYFSGYASGSTVYFAPDQEISRIEVIVLLYRLAGSPEVSGTHPFEDSTAGWYQDALTWAWQNGIAAGTGETAFSPSESITREAFATLLYRYAEGTAADSDCLADYTDADSVSSWAEDAVSWCVANGIINSTSTASLVISPAAKTNRATAAQLLYNYLLIDQSAQ